MEKFLEKSFINNSITVEQLAHAMRLGTFGERIVIKSKFADVIDSRIKIVFADTNLRRIRLTYGLRQVMIHCKL